MGHSDEMHKGSYHKGHKGKTQSSRGPWWSLCPPFVCFVILISTMVGASCGANQEILKSGKDSPTPATMVEPAKNTIERDLEEFRTADFTYIFVLRRRDGGIMDADDRKVIKQNTEGANRRVSADNDRAFIIGSNPQLTPEMMAALNARFIVEDHSPQPPPPVTGNTNSNKAK